jgi:hypothetical protein
MLNRTLTDLIIFTCALLPACAAVLPEPTLPSHYTCTDSTFVNLGSQLAVVHGDRGPENVDLGWVDDSGRHYVRWPTAVTDQRSTEYTIPDDHHADATVKRYDTREGSAKQDWVLLGTSSCAPDGGYSDALNRYARGESMAEIQKALALKDKSQARTLVHDAMIALQRRYFRDQ